MSLLQTTGETVKLQVELLREQNAALKSLIDLQQSLLTELGPQIPKDQLKKLAVIREKAEKIWLRTNAVQSSAGNLNQKLIDITTAN